MTRFIALPAAIALTTLGGCASDPAYPSLAVRDVERTAITDIPPAPVPSPSAPSPALATRIDGVLAEARRADAAFQALLPAARRAARAGSGAGVTSDAYGTAQVALAELETRRSLASVPLADISAAYAQARLDNVDITTITPVRDAIVGIVAREDAALEELRAALR